MFDYGSRKIIHIDMDAFFASVEQRDFPQLRGKPVVVGGEGKRSVVAAASYEARKFGIFSAMPMTIAKRKCPSLIIVPHRFEVYKGISREIRSIFHEYTHLVEPLSLDEAYLDVTHNLLQIPVATEIAREIKVKIKTQTGLSCSAGVSVNKFLAKVASGWQKPDGLTTIKPSQVLEFLDELPIDKFFGIGRVTASKLNELGIFTGHDLRKMELKELIKRFGKSGSYYYYVCRGIDERQVTSDHPRKSISVERTFEDDLFSKEVLQEILKKLCQELMESMVRLKLTGRTIHLKWRYPDFSTPTRSRSLFTPTTDFSTVSSVLRQLFEENVDISKGIRLLGIGFSNLNEPDEETQLTLAIQ